MKRIAVYSVVLMAVGVVLSAYDANQPAATPTPRSGGDDGPLNRLIFEVTPLPGADAVTPAQMASALEIVRKRLEIMELVSSTVELSGTSIIVVDMPGTADVNEVTGILLQRGLIEFVSASSNPPPNGVYIVTELGSPDPEAKPVDTSGVVYPVVLTSEDLLTGGAQVNTQSGMTDLQLTMTEAGKSKLAGYTRTHIDSSMPILLDKYVLVSPVIRDEIAGGVLALGGLEDAQLRSLLAAANSGVLPVHLALTTVETVAPK